jgi:hypothetical protein
MVHQLAVQGRHTVDLNGWPAPKVGHAHAAYLPALVDQRDAAQQSFTRETARAPRPEIAFRSCK